jgi:hypothetical protein
MRALMHGTVGTDVVCALVVRAMSHCSFPPEARQDYQRLPSRLCFFAPVRFDRVVAVVPSPQGKAVGAVPLGSDHTPTVLPTGHGMAWHGIAFDCVQLCTRADCSTVGEHCG